jgi:PKD repeat protein
VSNNQIYCGPSSTTILSGNQISISNLIYKWIKSSTDSNTNYSIILNSNTKDFLPSFHSQTSWYRRVVSFGSYIDTSNAIYIKINARPISIIDTLSNLTQCRTGNSFKFHDNSILNSGTIVSRVWNFGDNTTSTLINPEKSYSNAGVYQVSLVIESDLGCKDTNTVFVKVSQLPTPRFNISRISQCLLYNKFEFVNSSTVSGGVIKSSYWDFGDGTFTSTTNAFKSYALAGNYIVKLIVTTNLGCVDSITKTVTVLQNPSAGKIAGAYDNLTRNTPYLYNINQQLNHIYNWEIQNGAIVSGQGTNAVSVQWLANGIGKLNCILTNTINCVDTAKLSVNIGFIGIENNRKTKLNIHPNPTTHTIHIDGLSTEMNNSAMIYSIQGQLLKLITTIENAEIDLSDFNPGVYLIKINDVAHRVVKL